MTKEELNNFIRFSDQKEYIENKLYKEEWVTVYQSKKINKDEYIDDICFYSYLVNEERKNKDYKKQFAWIMMNSSRPEIIERNKPLNLIDTIRQKLFGNLIRNFYMNNFQWTSQQLKKRDSASFKIKNFFFKRLKFLFSYKIKRIKTYYRFPEKSIEPLVHIRNFERSNFLPYIEISEEFRHYFNLYEDKNKNIFLSCDDSGNSIEVVKIVDKEEEGEVQIKKKYINEFLFVKKMWLCVQFYNIRWIRQTLDKPIEENFDSENYIYSLNSINIDFKNKKSSIRFKGRKFIKYRDLDYLWYEKERKYEKFAFIDENGDEREFTCEKDKLADYFGKNKDSPNYLRPISFRKDVLKKYYDKPDQYSVRDGYLSCEGFWRMEIDIMDNRVSVFLGDLSDLPYIEQKHWRSYNITEKASISRVNWERSFEGKFTETDRPDFFFKNKYKEFNQSWDKKYGWSFFKSLSEIDKYCFDSLRIPLNEEQSEFDTQIQNLTKIFIESINIKELKKTFSLKGNEKNKTIDILEQCLKDRNIQVNGMIIFLRKLQKLRSKGPAHIETDAEYMKILNYFKQLEGIKNPDSKIEIFSEILIRCIWTIRLLTKYFLD